MAMKYSPNGGAGSRTFVIKLLMVYGLVFRVLFYQNCSSGTSGVCWKIWDLSVMILLRVIAGYGLTC